MEIRRYANRLSYDQNALYHAVKDGTLAQVEQKFIPFSTLNGDKQFFDYWLLIVALRRKCSEIVQFLLDQNCQVEIAEKTMIWSTPLYYACDSRESEIIKVIIKRGASIHKKDKNQLSPLEFALVGMKTTLINALLEGHSSLLEENEVQRATDIFQLACLMGNAEIVGEFIGKKINVNSPSVFHNPEWSGFTPLHFAVYGRQKAIYHLLLKHDADIHAIDKRGDTPLHLAFKNNEHPIFFCEDVVEEYLRNLGRREFSNPLNEEGISHFHIICASHIFRLMSDEQKRYMDQHLKTIQFYIDKKVDINLPVSLQQKNYSGYSALHFAVSNSAFEISKLLLKNGADLKKIDKAGHTPLHLVCKNFDPNLRFKYPTYRYDNESIVELLLDHGANPDVADAEGSTPLHLTFREEAENSSLLDLLLSKMQLKINLTNKQGLSYFHVACSRSDLSTVQTLISSGATINSCISLNSDLYTNMSALQIAVYFNQKDIVDYLLVHGADVNFKSFESQMNALHSACRHTYQKLFKFSYLADENCNSREYNIDWETNRKDQYGIIKSLLKFGAAINEKDSHGHTPLWLACRTPADFIMDQYHGPPAARNYFRKKLVNEIRIRHEHIVDILLRHGAEIQAHDYPILHGIINDMIDQETFSIGETLLNKLFEKGVNVNSIYPEVEGRTALHVVVCYVSDDTYALKIMDKLLDHPQINVNIQTKTGETPLHLAVARRRNALVEKLLELGADVNVLNNDGKSPIAFLCDILRNEHQAFRDNHHSLYCIILVHVKRLMKLNLSISAQVKFNFSTLLRFKFPFNEPPRGLDEKINAELEAMKLKKVDTHTSLYDILRKSAKDMSKFVRNYNFNEIMTSPDLRSDYPVFSGMLKVQSRVGRLINLKLESAKMALNSLTGIYWPDICSDHIFKYLGDKDREILSKIKFHKRSIKRKAVYIVRPCKVLIQRMPV